MQSPNSAPSSATEWWELYLQTPESLSEIVGAYLHDLGSTAVVFHDTAHLRPHLAAGFEVAPEAANWTVLQGAFPSDDSLPKRISELQTFLQSLATDLADTPWQLYGRPLQDTAYLTQWRQFFQPVHIHNQLIILPPWDTTPIPPPAVPLVLEPGLAFGTGSHPTTYLALVLLAECLAKTPHRTLLDVGCGSGILSLGGLKLGVENARGVDLEEPAITVATQNARLNHLQHQAQFQHGSWELADGQYDLITANIYLGPLVNMLHALAQHLMPQGTMILSGILTFQESALRTALDTAHLDVIEQRVKDNWVALAVTHRETISRSQ